MTPISHTEAERQTRRDRIDPKLKSAGWRVVPFDPNVPLSAKAKRNSTDAKGDRWRSFAIEEIKQRNFKIDSLKWLKDESLDDGDEVLDPEALATEAIVELDSAVEELKAILLLLENDNGLASPESTAKKI